MRNFGTTENMPSGFTHGAARLYYLSRFLYAFLIIDLFFCVAALVAGLAAPCAPLAAYVAAGLAGFALFCCAFSASIMTAAYVIAQEEFRHAGRFARVGVKATAFTWTILALTALATVGYLLGGLVSRRREGSRRQERGRRHYEKQGGAAGQHDAYVQGDADSTRRLHGGQAPVALNNNMATA